MTRYHGNNGRALGQVRRANYDFYVSVSEGCCRGLQQHQFPVFQPGATAGR